MQVHVYISRILNIRELLERSDCRIFREAMRTKFAHCKDFTRKEFHQLRTTKTRFLPSHSGNRALQIALCE